MTGWSPLAKTLLQSAKEDAPSAAARAKVWSSVAATVALGGATTGVVVAGGATTAAGSGLATLASAKMLVMGALLGSAATIGIAVTAFYVRTHPLPPLQPAAAIAPMALHAAGARFAALSAPVSVDSSDDVSALAIAPPSVRPLAATARPHVAVKPAQVKPIASAVAATDSGEDALMREASLVAEARSAIRRGDPSGALAAVRAARALPSHQLAPEEMALEAQALHAINGAQPATSSTAGAPGH